MKKRNWAKANIFLYILIACLLSYQGFVWVFDQHYMALEYPVEPCCAIKATMEIPEAQVIVQSDRQLALKTARLIASLHEYEMYRYDCDEFSWDLRAQLYSVGIKSHVVYGKVNCYSGKWSDNCEIFDGGHAWVYIPVLDMYIEATNGQEIPHSNLLYVYGYVEPKKLG